MHIYVFAAICIRETKSEVGVSIETAQKFSAIYKDNKKEAKQQFLDLVEEDHPQSKGWKEPKVESVELQDDWLERAGYVRKE